MPPTTNYHVFDAVVNISPIWGAVGGGIWAILKGVGEMGTLAKLKIEHKQELALKEITERNINTHALATLKDDVELLKKLQKEDDVKDERITNLITKMEAKLEVFKEMVQANNLRGMPISRRAQNEEI